LDFRGLVRGGFGVALGWLWGGFGVAGRVHAKPRGSLG